VQVNFTEISRSAAYSDLKSDLKKFSSTGSVHLSGLPGEYPVMVSDYDIHRPADRDDQRVYDSPSDEQKYDACQDEGNDADQDAGPAVFQEDNTGSTPANIGQDVRPGRDLDQR